jgi:hypothetical protein
MIDNLIPVQLTRGTIYFREPSFHEYKNICKILISSDTAGINNCFNNVLNSLIVDKRPLNIIDKFKCLLAIRNTIHGNDIAVEIKGKKINHDLSLILDMPFDDIAFKFKDLTFASPTDFFIDSYDELIAQCLVKVKDIDVTGLTIANKIDIINEVTLPLTLVYKKITENFATRSFTFYKDVDLNIYDSVNILAFLRNIFQENLLDIYNFEYACMRNLNLKSIDFNTYTYPELKIFINYLNKENSEHDKSMSDK